MWLNGFAYKKQSRLHPRQFAYNAIVRRTIGAVMQKECK